MKKFRFHTGKTIDKSVLDSFVSQLFLQYEERFNKVPSKSRMDFIKNLNTRFSHEFDELQGYYSEYKKLLSDISRAKNIDNLAKIHQQLNRLTAQIFIKNGSVTEVHQYCTTYRDRLTLKIISITKKQLESTFAKPNNTFAWIRMGSTGREEQTLFTDQDNLLVYKNKLDKNYYTEFASQMVDNLQSIGFDKCKGKIMPTNTKWFGTLGEWKTKLHSYILDRENLLNLIVLTDAKYSGGNYPLAQALIREFRNVLKTYHASFNAIAKATVLMPIAMTIFNRFKTQKKGEYKNMFNIKFQGWLPLIMLTLLFSLENNVWETNTIKRIHCLEKKNLFEPLLADSFMDAYFILTKYKILAQIDFLNGKSKTLNYFINPYKLNKFDQAELKTALTTVEKFQKLATFTYNISETI